MVNDDRAVLEARALKLGLVVRWPEELRVSMGDSEFEACIGRDKAASTCDEIMMGEFDDDAKCVISFYHELGHTVGRWPDGASRYVYALLCWARGLELALEDEVAFDDATVKWALDESLATYAGR